MSASTTNPASLSDPPVENRPSPLDHDRVRALHASRGVVRSLRRRFWSVRRGGSRGSTASGQLAHVVSRVTVRSRRAALEKARFRWSITLTTGEGCDGIRAWAGIVARIRRSPTGPPEPASIASASSGCLDPAAASTSESIVGNARARRRDSAQRRVVPRGPRLARGLRGRPRADGVVI